MLPREDVHSIYDFCLACGHNHLPETYKDKTKARHCTVEGCKCLARHFVGRSRKGHFG